MSDEPHSALYLSDARFSWWNPAQLRRALADLDVTAPVRVLDVGCGQGHWTRTLAPLLPAGSSVHGVDREAAWIDAARRGADVPGVSLTFAVGDATALEAEGAAYDVVTCQTLLIHLRDLGAALRGFARVLRPGGLLLVAEPNNTAEVARHADPGTDVDDWVAAFRLEVTCEKGKHALGLGYNSLGERLVNLLDDAHWHPPRAWLCDKVRVNRPPYGPDAKAALDDERRQFDSGAVGWSKDETERYFHAGGGDPAAFEDLWSRARRLLSRRLADLEAGRAAGLDGSLFYLIAARRRELSVSTQDAHLVTVPPLPLGDGG